MAGVSVSVSVVSVKSVSVVSVSEETAVAGSVVAHGSSVEPSEVTGAGDGFGDWPP